MRRRLAGLIFRTEAKTNNRRSNQNNNNNNGLEQQQLIKRTY